MFFEAEFWVAVAFAIFAAILWKAGAFRQMTDALDQRGKRIQAELDEAKRLREEAARVLADYQKRRTEAERGAAEAQQRMEDFVKRRTAAAEAKIAQAETQAMAEVRAAAADAAIQVSEAILRERMAGDAAQELMISKSLADVRRKLNA